MPDLYIPRSHVDWTAYTRLGLDALRETRRWALGIVLYECCTGQHPFDADNQGALVMRILRGKYAPVPAGTYSEELRDIVKSCLHLSSKSRPSCDVLLGLAAVQGKARELKLDIPAPAPKSTQAGAGEKKRRTTSVSSKKAVASGSKSSGAKTIKARSVAEPAEVGVHVDVEEGGLVDDSGASTTTEQMRQQVVEIIGEDKYVAVHQVRCISCWHRAYLCELRSFVVALEATSRNLEGVTAVDNRA